MGYKKKTWQEKLEDSKAFPKVKEYRPENIRVVFPKLWRNEGVPENFYYNLY